MRLKIRDSHLTCKVTNKCLNVHERLEVVEWNKRWSPPFPCCPVNRQCLWKKTLIEKKKKKKRTVSIFLFRFKTLKRPNFSDIWWNWVPQHRSKITDINFPFCNYLYLAILIRMQNWNCRYSLLLQKIIWSFFPVNHSVPCRFQLLRTSYFGDEL